MDHNCILIICLMVTIISCQPFNQESGRNLAQQVSEIKNQFGRYAPEYEKTVGEYEPQYESRYAPEYPLSRFLIPPPISEPVDNIYREWYPHMFTKDNDNYREVPSPEEMLPELESGGKYMGILPTRNFDDATIQEEEAGDTYMEWYPHMYTKDNDNNMGDALESSFNDEAILPPPTFNDETIRDLEGLLEMYPELPTRNVDDIDSLDSQWNHQMLPGLQLGETYEGPVATQNVDNVDSLYVKAFYPVLLPELQSGGKRMGLFQAGNDDDVDTIYSYGENVIENKLKEEDPSSNMIFDLGKEFLKIKN